MEILYNTEFHRWEVYGETTVIRAGEPQPRYVSAERDKCEAYKKKVEGRKCTTAV